MLFYDSSSATVTSPDVARSVSIVSCELHLEKTIITACGNGPHFQIKPPYYTLQNPHLTDTDTARTTNFSIVAQRPFGVIWECDEPIAFKNSQHYESGLRYSLL